jgi:hypothetical protein
MVLMGDVVLQSTVLPDRPGLALFLSLYSGMAATIIMTWLGREPF